jgi:putative nucleotidyltransferase with HDIG domain
MPPGLPSGWLLETPSWGTAGAPMPKTKLPRGTTGVEIERRASWTGRHPRVARILLLIVTSLLISALLVEWQPLAGTRGLIEGKPAPSDVRATSQIAVTDKELTLDKRRQARESVSDVFVYDVLLIRSLDNRVVRAFDTIREAEGPAPHGAGELRDPAQFDTARRRFEEELGVQLNPVHLSTLESAHFDTQIERDVLGLLKAGMAGPVSLEDLGERDEILLIRVEGRARSEEALADLSAVRSLRATRQAMVAMAMEDLSDRPAYLRDAAVHLAQQLCRANLRLDASETSVRQEKAAAAIQPVTTSYERGEIIVRSGERVSAWTLRVIKQMNEDVVAYHPVRHWLSLGLLLAIFLAFIERFGVRFISKFHSRFNDLLAMAALLLVVTSIAALLAGLGAALNDAAATVPSSAYLFLVPVAVGGIIVRTLMNAESTLMWSLAAAVLCAAIAGGDPLMWIYYLGSALAAAGGVGQATERGRLIRAGFIASLANVGLALLIDLAQATAFLAEPIGSNTVTEGLFHVLFALCGGLFSGVLAVGLVPVFEAMGFLTDTRLLELGSMNHPLIREMVVKAPGTYHHSMVVGSLAEQGAESIHANSLLVRVAAPFHDLGKMLKPQYFIENQRGEENPHDRLTPSMSALVIVSHVKEGIELARKNGLPEPIIDMIPQHHGTSIVSFFYAKALEQADPNKAEVDESDYRYPGPKPQTKEGGIMMIADGVEAATRSLKNHSEGAIRNRVQAIINRVVQDGQLEECPLTLKDLHTVSETFVRVLLGIYHHRIEYPDLNLGGADNRSTKRPRGAASGPSITLEIPARTPNPDDPHPLDHDGQWTGTAPADKEPAAGHKGGDAENSGGD